MNKKLFITIESLIYLLFMTFDYLELDFHQEYLKYLGIILCLIYASFKIKPIFVFTLIADYFLLIKDEYYEIGVMFFIVVQLLYLKHLKDLEIAEHYLLRISVSIIGIVFLCTTNMYSVLNILTIVYFSQLLVTTILTGLNKKHKLLFVGLCLFVCCDLCVGLHNLYPYNDLIALGQWFFYLPSQVIIALSSRD